MPGVDFNVLRSEISMEDVLQQLRFQATDRAGDQLHGPCPVHGSTSPGSRTFSVNVAKGQYYCHKCHSKGNQLELLAAVHELSPCTTQQSTCTGVDSRTTFPGFIVGEAPFANRTTKRHEYFELPTTVICPNNLKHFNCP